MDVVRVSDLSEQVRVLAEEITDRKQRLAELREELESELAKASATRKQAAAARKLARDAIAATKEKRERRKHEDDDQTEALAAE